MVAGACKPCTQEAESELVRGQGQPGLQSEA